MKAKRDFVTPYLGFIFLIVGISGILMFFHLADNYTSVVHEFLGLTFFLFSILHIITNWNSIKSYSKRKKLIIPGVTVLIVGIVFIVGGKLHGNLEQDLLEKLLKSPVSDSFKVLNIDYDKAKLILQKNSIAVQDSSESIEEIGTKNHKSPDEILELIMK